jgi:metallo-beta-lactamase family protein
MSIKITFCGAAGMVTGSCYYVQTPAANFIVDAGMFQGPKDEEFNFAEYPFNPAEADFLILTHAHLDHVGLLPRVVKEGFRGRIFSTLHTNQIGSIIMFDSAKIQENNFSRGVPWEHTGRIQMLYNSRDVEQALSQFEVVDYDTEFSPVAGMNITFRAAGHILGAISAEIEVDGRVIVFSGDIGRVNQPLIPNFDLNHKREVDFVLMESLYGGQEHPKRNESVQELIDIIHQTVDRGGNVFIPSFAVQRTQELLHDFMIAKSSGALDRDLQVYLDSPMAANVTHLYADALDHTENSNFQFPGLNYVRHSRQSAKLGKSKGIVIIAGSGMASGGRIVQHLAQGLRDARNSVAFVGYQAEATMGRELTDGANQVVIDDVAVNVKAEVYHLSGFSAHGDNKDLLTWVERYNSPKLKKMILVHAETERANTFKGILEGLNIDHPVVPKRLETIEL